MSDVLQVRTEDWNRRWRVVTQKFRGGRQVGVFEESNLTLIEAVDLAAGERGVYKNNGWVDNGEGGQYKGDEFVYIFVAKDEKLEPNS